MLKKNSNLAQVKLEELMLIYGGNNALPPSPSPDSPIWISPGTLPSNQGTINIAANITPTDNVTILPTVNVNPSNGNVNGGGFSVIWRAPF